MGIKVSNIAGLTMAVIIFGMSAMAGAQSNTLKAESIDYLEKKVLYSKPKVNPYNWYDYKRGMFIAGKENKYVLLSFCVRNNSYCLKLDENTYANPAVKKLLAEKFVTVKVDAVASNLMNISNKKLTEKDLLKQYEVEGYPTIAFLDSSGRQVSGAIKGYLPPDKFLTVLKYISSDSYKSIKFRDFMLIEERNKVK